MGRKETRHTHGVSNQQSSLVSIVMSKIATGAMYHPTLSFSSSAPVSYLRISPYCFISLIRFVES